MRRVYVLVEGQTEETFVRQLLEPHLRKRGVSLTAIIIATKRAKAGGKFRGGIISFDKIYRELNLLLKDRQAHAVTTMIDLYGLPVDFPGHKAASALPSGQERVELLEQSLAAAIGDRRFLPYLSCFEFEALLFSQPETVERTLQRPGIAEALAQIVVEAGSPEGVNDGPDTHPAARIAKLAPTYRKALHGPIIAQRTGLTEIRRQCSHFSRWLLRLEALAE